jgi:hypothetical protein
MNVLEAYRAKFGDIDTFSLYAVMDADELTARLQRAIDENKPIDVEKEYGLAPAPKDSLL